MPCCTITLLHLLLFPGIEMMSLCVAPSILDLQEKEIEMEECSYALLLFFFSFPLMVTYLVPSQMDISELRQAFWGYYISWFFFDGVTFFIASCLLLTGSGV
jgi:hypothetical protein